MNPGYAGKILRVDLSTKSVSTMDTAPYSERFLGGRGIALKILWDEVPPGVGPFDPDNKLILMTGPITGTPAPTSGRVEAWAVSPHTYPKPDYCYTNFGGRWGPELKFAGYDGIVVEGNSSSPCYIMIDDDKVEILDAGALWGQDTFATQQSVEYMHGPGFKTLCIGPAGETKCRFAVIITDTGSAGGTGGFGAIMGAKNLKAIAVRGTGAVPIAKPKELLDICNEIKSILFPPDYTGPQPMSWNTPGYSSAVRREYATHDVKATRLDGCFGCPVLCRYYHKSPDVARGEQFCQSSSMYIKFDKAYHGRETPASFEASKICDKLGLDTRDTQFEIDWLLKCHENGLLTDAETGLPLSKIGTREFMHAYAQAVCSRQGFGDVLAEGVARAAFDITKKGQEFMETELTHHGMFNSYEPRIYPAHALLYALDVRTPIGQGLHESSFPLTFARGVEITKWGPKAFWTPMDITDDAILKIAEKLWGSREAADQTTYAGKALACMKIQQHTWIKQMFLLCDFVFPLRYKSTGDRVCPGSQEVEAKLLSTVTGDDYSPQDLDNLADRSFTLFRALLMREGRTRNDDVIAEFHFTKPLKYTSTGPNGKVTTFERALDKNEFEKMKDEYYQLRNWDVRTGNPTERVFRSMGLDEVARELEDNYEIQVKA